jgi:hypothetical protein
MFLLVTYDQDMSIAEMEVFELDNSNFATEIDKVVLYMSNMPNWNVALHIHELSDDKLGTLKNKINECQRSNGYSLHVCSDFSSVSDVLIDISENNLLTELDVDAAANTEDDKPISIGAHLTSLTMSKHIRDVRLLSDVKMPFNVPEYNTLTSLILNMCNLKSIHVRYISEMKQLRLTTFNIADNDCEDDTIDSLTLMVQTMPLVNLNIRNNRITDLGIAKLTGACESLESLNCSSSQKSDSLLSHILPVMDFSRCNRLTSLQIGKFSSGKRIICPMSLETIYVLITEVDTDPLTKGSNNDFDIILKCLVGTNVNSCSILCLRGIFPIFTHSNYMLETLAILGCTSPTLSYVESMLDMLPNLKHASITNTTKSIISDVDADKLEQIIKEKTPQMRMFVVWTLSKKIYTFHCNLNTDITLTSLCSAAMHTCY